MLALAGCEKAIEPSDSTSSGSQLDDYLCPQNSTAPLVNETAFCSTVQTFGDAVTITGGARYQKRLVQAGVGLGAVDGSLLPIRHAEMAVIDSSGTVIQCGVTDASGNFSISVPRSSTALSFQVRSRSDNANLKASILDSHNDMSYYAAGSAITPNTSKAVGNIVADATGSTSGSQVTGLQSGAFNIMDKLLDANNYLRAQAGSCASDYPNIGCSDFTVAPKVNVFWKPGCNPMKYFNDQATSGVSFYISGSDRLYILGGTNADVNTSDTDHFDDVIILHEYGHFIEGQFSNSDSPGGSHDGNTIVDPRLAWSEAWASFFASAVRDVGEYVDTYGNASGSTGFFFSYNAETNSTGVGTLDPKESYTVPSGEGNFREMGLFRALWDSIDTDAADSDNDGVEGSFQELWAVFSGTNGIKNSTNSFVNAGLFFGIHSAMTDTPKTDYSSIFTAEKIKANTEDYATPVSTGSSCTISITPANANNFSENGTLANSNLFASNDFYRLRLSSATTANLVLDITSGTGDLDLYLYKSSYTFGSGSTLIGFSNTSTTGPTGDETVALSNLPAGDYMINVNSYATSASLNANQYKLLLGGAELCP